MADEKKSATETQTTAAKPHLVRGFLTFVLLNVAAAGAVVSVGLFLSLIAAVPLALVVVFVGGRRTPIGAVASSAFLMWFVFTSRGGVVPAACELGQSSTVGALLRFGAFDPSSAYGADSWTALHFAAAFGRRSVVRVLLSHGAPVSAVDINGSLPLHLACRSGDVDSVMALVAADVSGTHIGQGDKVDGDTPLHIAAVHDRADVVSALIRVGAAVNSPNGKSKRTPLYVASREGSIAAVAALIAAGADLNKEDRNGWTPLEVACERGHRNVVEMLAKNGVDLNKKDRFGQSPMFISLAASQRETAEAMLLAGAKVTAREAPLIKRIFGPESAFNSIKQSKNDDEDDGHPQQQKEL